MGFHYHHYLGDSIYKSTKGKKIVIDHYHKTVKDFGIKCNSKWIKTIFGKTHVLICGPKHGKPIIFIPPRNIINPLALQLFKPLVKKYRIYAPDIIGLPGLSDETRLNTIGDKYGKWITEVMNGLKLDKASIIGSSFGAFIVMQTAAFSPKKIDKAILINPVGISKIPKTVLLFNLWLKYFLYTLNPTVNNLMNAIGPHFSDKPDQKWINSFQIIYKNVKIGMETPRTLNEVDLKDFTSPTLIFASTKDKLYRIKELEKYAKILIPKLENIEILKTAKHMPSKKDLILINNKILNFLDK